MKTNDTQVMVYVTYPGGPGDTFDHDHYVKEHLPLVMESWSRYGLLSLEAFHPAAAQGRTLALCECVFRDEAAMEAAFASPEAARVMADVARFTSIAPRRVRAVAL